MLKCGMSEIDITPPLGCGIPGLFRPRYSTGIKNKLCVKSMVLDDGSNIAVFVVMDTIAVEREDVLNIRKIIKEQTGIPEDCIMVSATHVHTGPPVTDLYVVKKDSGYMERLIKKAADAAIIAFNQRVPARIGFGTGMEKDIAFNRRYKMKDGSVKTNPGIGNPHTDMPVGPIDPEVTVMRIDDIEGHPLGVVTNYACHLDTVGGTEYCPDYPGELALIIKKVFGHQVISLFFSGACGNINHVDVNGSKERDPLHYVKMGRILAGEVLKVREKIKVSDEWKLGTALSTFLVAVRRPTEESVRKAQQVLELPASSQGEKNYAVELLKAHANQVESVEVEVQVVRIGELAVAGMPGEIFTEFGLDIKKRSPFCFNMINELANGSNGYIATRDAFTQGGYETVLTSYTRLVPEAGYEMVDKIIELLSERTLHTK